MSLLELLKDAYSANKNFENRNFIHFEAARRIITSERIDDWSKSHPLCLEHGSACPERINLIRRIPNENVYVFAVLALAELEFLTKELLACGSRDSMLFDNRLFEHYCNSAGLSSEQEQSLVKCRSYVGVIFTNDGTQDVPKDAILPYLKRESLDRYGSYGVLYRLTVPGQHLRGFNHEVTVAEKRIRPNTDASQDDWQKLFREVTTLRERQNHPHIIALLASYSTETDESGQNVKILHLLFPLADMDLADWMNMPRVPFNVAGFSRQERQRFLYRSMLALASGVSYLHREIDGLVTAHHDLKPRNILVANDQLRIADLGHSHLRPLLEGSATEGASGLGTYEYQPPEYWNEDGSRANILHGRQFDVWAMGCIILEMAILVVDDWQTSMITDFKIERKANRIRDRKPPELVRGESDVSFHNNMSVVEDWIERLETYNDSQQFNGVLGIAAQMLSPEPHHRPYAWEVELDLYETLKPFDRSIPDLEEDLCVPPPIRDNMVGYDCLGPSYDASSFWRPMETPLHRAARSRNRQRIIRLWELGWPINLPDREFAVPEEPVTPQDIMKSSEDVTIRELERDSIRLIYFAKTGNMIQLRELFSRGLSPLMANANGTSALHEAINSLNIDLVDFLLQSKAREQLMLRETLSNRNRELPSHKAARLGFVAALERMLRCHPDISVLDGDGNTALCLATSGGHLDAVRLLLDNKAQLLPSIPKTRTPLHAAVLGCGDAVSRLRYLDQPESHTTAVWEDILNLLLGADGAHECLECLDFTGSTPLEVAVTYGHVNLFELLLQHGASVHTNEESEGILRIIARHNRPEILELCIDRFSLEDFQIRPGSDLQTPLEIAQNKKHKKVVQLMKSHVRELRRSAGGDSGSRRKFAIFERLKSCRYHELLWR